MVGRGSLAALLVALVMSAALAGCFGGDEKPKPSQDKDDPGTGDGDGEGGGGAGGGPTGGGTGEGEGGCTFQFCLEGHVYAPAWSEGMTWTYGVTGSFFPTQYDATMGVFQVADDHYKLGSGTDDELKNAVTWDSAMVGAVQKDSLGILKTGEYQDLLGFRKLAGNTWEFKGLLQNDWELTKSASTEITWAGGTSLGFRVEGKSGRGDFLNVEYASDARWITKLEWLDPSSNPLVVYELKSTATGADTSGFRYWTRGVYAVAVPLGATPLGVAQWNSDGTADHVLLRFITAPGVVAQGRVIDPAGGVYEAQHSSATTVQVADEVVSPDAAGRWIGTVITDRGGAPSSGAPGMNVWMMQIHETKVG